MMIDMATRAWKRPRETSSAITYEKMFWNNCFQGNCRGDYLEKGAYGLDVLVGEDDHTKESGESTVKDVRSGSVD